MVEALADELIGIVDKAATELRTLSDAVAAQKRDPKVWSIKEIVGHLIDSAANNHHRFIRAQQANDFAFPGYEQDAWVDAQDYQSRPWLELIEFWALYNHHLAHTIRRIPDAAVNVQCRIGLKAAVTLDSLLQDYLIHLRHHLRQINERRAAEHASS